MGITQAPTPVVRAAVAAALALLAGCGSTPQGPPKVAVAPMCTVHLVSFGTTGVESALVSERTDAATPHGFTPFRSIAPPRGNATVGFTRDVYGFSEVWSRNASGPVVVRAQAHPAPRRPTGVQQASAWTLHAQDAAGSWSPPLFTDSANRGDEPDTPATGGATVPQLMAVGTATPQVFGCAGGRSNDNAVRTTWLVEVTPPDPATGTRSSVSFIQDLLSGDDRFVPNQPGILVGPATPPVPGINGRPGHPVREGMVRCAMTQFEDDVSTRELHMVTIVNGVLHHSMASNFGPVASGSRGSTFNRFRTVSPWSDVGQAAGRGAAHVQSVDIVGQPRAVQVLFATESGGLHQLWRTARFSAGGNWRPADDVFGEIGIWPRGRSEPIRVAAGMCPVLGTPHESELVYVLWNADNIKLGRIVSTPRQWAAPIFGTYSQLWDLSHLIGGNADPAQQSTFDSLRVGGRPFRDDARP